MGPLLPRVCVWLVAVSLPLSAGCGIALELLSGAPMPTPLVPAFLAASLTGTALGVSIDRGMLGRHWAPAAATAALCTLLVAFAVLALRAILVERHGGALASPGSMMGVHRPMPPPLFRWLGLLGIGLGTLSLLAARGPRRALMRALKARAGKVDSGGRVLFHDQGEGRAAEDCEVGPVIAWRDDESDDATDGYRVDAGPDHYHLVPGNRLDYVDAHRRCAMTSYLQGLAVLTLTNAPLVGALWAGLL